MASASFPTPRRASPARRSRERVDDLKWHAEAWRATQCGPFDSRAEAEAAALQLAEDLRSSSYVTAPNDVEELEEFIAKLRNGHE